MLKIHRCVKIFSYVVLHWWWIIRKVYRKYEYDWVWLKSWKVLNWQLCLSTMTTNRKKINPDFYDLGVPKDGIECKCAELIFIDSLFTRENITCKYIYTNGFINLQRKKW